jgi:hypothetical protein
MNRNFGKVKSDNSLEYAPDAVRVDGRIVIHPQAEQYARAADGPWLPNADTPPAVEPPQGYHYEARGWAVEDGRNVRQYAEVADPPPPPRVFRRSWLAQWIRGAGKWGAFAAFLSAPEAADLAFLWEYCTEFDEDSPQWPAALAAIKAALQLMDAEAEAMLAFGATGGAQ